MTPTIPDEAYHAALNAFAEADSHEDALMKALTAALPFLQGVKVDAQGIYDYVQSYEWRGDNGDYTPSDADREMLEDAIVGYLSAIEQAPSPRAKALEEAAQGELIDRLLAMRDQVMRGKRCMSVNGSAVMPVIDVKDIRLFEDVVSALSQGTSSERVQALEEGFRRGAEASAKIAFDVSENGEYHGEASVDSTSSIYQQGAFEVYEAIRALSPHFIEFAKLPNEKVSIPDPRNPEARIVGFRIREGDDAWGERGLSEPLFWLNKFINSGRALSQPVSPVMGIERPVEGGWLPIETAPNNKAILVHYDDGNIELISADDNEYSWIAYTVKEDFCTKPTHWRPLPQAPGVAV